jgi:NADH-quinone oxidoreductase subunit K
VQWLALWLLERKNELQELRYKEQEIRFKKLVSCLLKTFKIMPINYYIFLSLALFCIGVAGVLTRRNAIIIFMCVELMLNAVNLLMIAFSKMHHHALATVDVNAGINGQIFVFFIMVVAAAEVSVGLAIIVMMYRNTHSVDVNFLNRLKH